MQESIAARVGRIVSGSLNALVGALENTAPETVMAEAIREIDGAIDDVRAELGRAVAAKHLANSRLAEENRRHQALTAQIESAVAQGRDDLAEAGIAGQLDIEAQIPVLERTIAEHAERERELEGYVRALQAKKREMQDELQEFLAARRAAGTAAGEAGLGLAQGAGVDARVAKAEQAFDAILRRQAGIGPAGRSQDPGLAAKLAELEELARGNRIRERLAALKADKP